MLLLIIIVLSADLSRLSMALFLCEKRMEDDWQLATGWLITNRPPSDLRVRKMFCIIGT